MLRRKSYSPLGYLGGLFVFLDSKMYHRDGGVGAVFYSITVLVDNQLILLYKRTKFDISVESSKGREDM